MKKALIYSFSFDGHRQVYAQYFIEALLKCGYSICLVSDSSEAGIRYPHLSPYQSNASVEFKTIQKALLISLIDFRRLQDDIEAGLTIFLDADNHLKLLTHQILPGHPRLRGKNIGIFIRSINYIHLSKWLPAPWFVLRYIKQNVMWLVKNFREVWDADFVIFHEIYFPCFKLLSTALTTDEVFMESHSHREYHWFPDLVFPLLPDDPQLEQTELERWEPLLQHFLEANQDKEVLFYFGLATHYKGYDTLLKLACEENCCFIHCGLFDTTVRHDEDVEKFRLYLNSQGLLFETDAYVQSYSAVRLFFESCKYVVLPYRNHSGSSGVMLQAVHFGKPVLVPDLGLMATRTLRHQLGLTYHPGNSQDLKSKWEMLKSDLSSFESHLIQYQRLFIKENMQRAVDTILDSME
jgi:glycosyltransferase involved in cell wall biosynthesis